MYNLLNSRGGIPRIESEVSSMKKFIAMILVAMLAFAGVSAVAESLSQYADALQEGHNGL